jgi:feruloyl esterase
MAPGTEHCGGGPGPDRPDMLTALEQWVEQGQAPATVIATHGSGPVTRPLCPFPTRARFDGTGDVNDPKAYRCG